jgi:hypothetical protein
MQRRKTAGLELLKKHGEALAAMPPNDQAEARRVTGEASENQKI